MVFFLKSSNRSQNAKTKFQNEKVKNEMTVSKSFGCFIG